MSAVGEQEILAIEKVKPLILWFLLFTALFTAPFYWLIAHFSSAYWYVIGMMWAPGLAALAACKFMGINNSILGWRWGKNKWMALSYLTPLVYLSIIYFGANAAGLVDFMNDASVNKWGDRLGLNGWSTDQIILLVVPLMMLTGFFQQMASATGEEIGWRGLLAPQLMRLTSFPVAAVSSGLIWFAWHIPVIIWGGYNTGYENLNTQMINFAVMLTAMSFPMLYLRLRSGSLWSGAVFHAAHNLFLLYIFSNLFLSSETSKYYVGEWGSITAGVTTVIALFTWHLARKNGLMGPLNR